jgi:integrase
MTKPMSTLRRHMIEDMKMRNMSPNSQKVYAYAVANFATFHGKSPDKLGPEHVREYRLRLIGRGLKATSINPIIGALRFFYGTTLRRKEMIEYIPYARREDTLPAVLTPDEVVRLFKAVPTRLPAAGLAGDQRHPVRAQQLHQRGAAIWRADSAYTELRHLLRSDLGSVRRDLQSAARCKALLGRRAGGRGGYRAAVQRGKISDRPLSEPQRGGFQLRRRRRADHRNVVDLLFGADFPTGCARSATRIAAAQRLPARKRAPFKVTVGIVERDFSVFKLF